MVCVCVWCVCEWCVCVWCVCVWCGVCVCGVWCVCVCVVCVCAVTSRVIHTKSSVQGKSAPFYGVPFEPKIRWQIHIILPAGDHELVHCPGAARGWGQPVALLYLSYSLWTVE